MGAPAALGAAVAYAMCVEDLADAHDTSRAHVRAVLEAAPPEPERPARELTKDEIRDRVAAMHRADLEKTAAMAAGMTA